MEEPFYKDGLKFSCKQCSYCCCGFAGVVRLSKEDLDRLVEWSGLTEEQFLQVYCRHVEDYDGSTFLSLRDLSNNSCILWEKGGCSAYQARPLQCRTYPFWKSVLKSEDTWKEEAKTCPGINTGLLHSREEIDAELSKMN